MKKYLLLITVLSSLTLNAQIPTNGLSVFYKFDGNLLDNSGNGFNASSNGNISYTPNSVSTSTDSMIHLNGVDSEIYYDYTGNESFFENQNFSCVTRVRLDTINLYNNILEIGNPASTTIYFRFLRSSVDYAHLQVGHYSAQANAGNNADYYIPFLFVDSIHNFGFSTSYDVATDIRTTDLYMDDSLLFSYEFTSDGAIDFGQVENKFNIGYRYNSTGLKLKGDIDFLMFYNRALDSTEMIQALAYNPTLGLTNVEENQIKIYPNPSNGIVTVSSPEIGSTIQILDATGRIIHSQLTISKNTTVDLSTQENGVYFVSLMGTNGLTNSKKLIVKK